MDAADELWAQGVAQYLLEVKANPQTVAGLWAFETSVQADPSDPKRLFFLATLLYHAGRHAEAEQFYRQVIEAEPASGHGYLELVLFLESAGRREEARRVACQAVKAGAIWADEWQRPPIFVRGLTSQPWWTREDFPWAADLEGAYPSIKAEMLELFGERGDHGGKMPQSWVRVGDERASQDGDIVAPGGEWREFLLYSAQDQSKSTANPEVLKLFPKTCELLESLLPGAVAMAKIGVGEIILSAISPGTKLTPHCASSNVRLTCHLGLVCPEGARVRVGPDWGTWEEGRCIFFDDSYEHEVVNDGKSVRIVLLIRFWHPELPAEKWLSTLNSGMEEYSAMLQRRVSPPANPRVAELLMKAEGSPVIALKGSPLNSAEQAAAVLKADAPDLAVSGSDMGLLEIRDELY
ncbi:ASPH [Symbiodinium sp. CCMP2456]|nr:ASPH [Symbiodinium sp. CCMP2456]